jgi:SPP1 family predicted phage head-tail adaptor
MNSNLYRHKITVQQKTVTGYGSRGEETYTWSTFVDSWASIRSLSSREKFNLGQRWPDADLALEMHFVASLTTAMRILDVCCSRTLDIKEAADPFGNRKMLRLVCREIV